MVVQCSLTRTMKRLYFFGEHLNRSFHYQVLIVAGGYDGSSLNSTELMTYKPGSEMKWRQAGPLPRSMYGVRMVNLNKYIYLLGGYNGSYFDDILQYKDGVWINDGKMKTKRGYHAVSVVTNKDVCR